MPMQSGSCVSDLGRSAYIIIMLGYVRRRSPHNEPGGGSVPPHYTGTNSL
jgi:hypothetical protein